MNEKDDKWVLLGARGYNIAYINTKTKIVFKHPLANDVTDTPERSVRLWNLLNPTLKPQAKLAKIKIDGVTTYGWTCPYIRTKHNDSQTFSINDDKAAYKKALMTSETKQQEDNDIVDGLIDIYNRTQRVIIDAHVPGNFVVTRDGAVCVDVGMALLLEKEEQTFLIKDARRNSVSHSTWENVHNDISSRVLNDNNPLFPNCVFRP